MSRLTIIYGPMASGKTFHSEAFRRHYQCHASIDLDEFGKQHPRAQKDGLLILTILDPTKAEKQVRKVIPDADIRFIDIRSARLAIGAAPDAPPLPSRRARP